MLAHNATKFSVSTKVLEAGRTGNAERGGSRTHHRPERAQALCCFPWARRVVA